MGKAFDKIYDYVRGLEIIDTHEHLPGSEKERDQNANLLQEYTRGYFCSDLISAGLSLGDFQKVIETKLPLMERWGIVEPYWEAARHTGYGRALDISAKALYGIERISRSTIEQLDREFKKSFQPGHFNRILKEKCKIKVSLLDSNLNCDQTFFRSVFRMDNFIYPTTDLDIKQIEKDSGIGVSSFDDWLKACETVLEKVLKKGAVALKSGMAYHRTLYFERATRHEAEKEFNKTFKTKRLAGEEFRPLTMDKKFQDYMMHFILGLAGKRKLTYQIHTGLQAGIGNVIYHSDPALLSNLFLEYPEVDFDIFHIGYPYQQVASVLAKNFPNVYLDMCWAHIISPTASINALIEWIDCVPINKISAFGGDYNFIDAVYGHLHLARINVSKSLAQKVEDGVFDIDRAEEISEMLFYKNPLKIFKLTGKI